MHINVFPTFENYVGQFEEFCHCIRNNGQLIYAQNDPTVVDVVQKFELKLNLIPYNVPEYDILEAGTVLHWEGQKYGLKIFGQHNLQNLIGAMRLAEAVGIKNHDFLESMADFIGASKRLEEVVSTNDFVMFKDFAHSPSKLKATTNAVKEQYPSRKVVACLELHTFSSLNQEFLPQFVGTMDNADLAYVYYNDDVVAHKNLPELSKDVVQKSFGAVS